MVLGRIDYIIIVIYLLGTVSLGAYLGRRMRTGKDYFLAGRSLPWWAIGMSLVVTDIGAVDMVGVAGSAYLYGIVLGNYDWLGSVPVMIIGAFLFIPMFWKSKVSTIPEWLGARYNNTVRTVSALIWGVYMAMALGIVLYASAVMFNVLLDLNPKIMIVSQDRHTFEAIPKVTDAKKYDFIFTGSYDEATELEEIHNPNLVLIDRDLLTTDAQGAVAEGSTLFFQRDEISAEWGKKVLGEARRPSWTIFYSIVLMGVIIGIYTLLGGLRAVVYTDVIQCVVMLGGSLFVLFFGIYKLGGVSQFVDTVHALGDRAQDHFSLILPADTKAPHPWSGIFFGLGLVLANAYWIGNQAIVQRSMGARSMADAKASYVFGSLLKVLIPFAMVIPGIIALAHNPNIADADKAMATLIRDIVPTGLLGIFFAAFLAGLMSSVDSMLNSAATIWTRDIYQNYISSNRDDHHYLVVGRWITLIFIVFSIYFAQYANRFSSIYELSQTLLSLFQGPSLAIIILGVLWKRTTGKGALAGLLTGVAFSSGLVWVNNNATQPLFQITEPFLYIAWWSFVVSISFTVIVSLLTSPEPDEKLRGMVYRYE
ncbi:MAG: sodium/solute symporter [Candidatus Marinimicrobia bacterium]|nr:sodium/solute symporter [Candidatus Neomarinimicrobiota bacterium]